MNRSWLPRLWKALTKGTKHRAHARKAHVRPTFESLEDRTLLSGVSPFVQSINRTTPAVPVTNATSVTYTVTFNEAVTGVALADFQLATTGTVAATLNQVTPSSSSIYTVTVSGITGSGTLGLNLVDNNSIRDLAGSGLVQPNAPAAFQAQTTYAVGASPSIMTFADVNGDGIPDLIVTSTASNVSVFLGNGNGTFHSQMTFATGSSPYSLAVGDVNGDGRPDLVTGNSGSDTVSILLGNGNGTFQKQVVLATGSNPLSMNIADVNSDGKADLIVGNAGANVVGVLLGNGNGTFQSQVNFSSGYTTEATVADVNGDGKVDLIDPNRPNSAVSVLLGNGDGTFQSALTFGTGNSPEQVDVADVNGDGKPDLILANAYLPLPGSGGTVSVLLGNGNGTFQAQRRLATGLDPFWVNVADINGDGNPDLLVANRGSNNLSVLLGNGNGTFQSQVTFACGAGPVGVTVADVNGDGRLDVALDNNTGNSVSVLLNAGNGNFTGQVYTIDTAAPFVQSINRTTPAVPVTNATSVTYTVTFNEAVTGVALADFQLATTGTVAATLNQVTPSSGSIYTVTVSGITGNGTLGLNLVDNNSIRDLAGDALVQPNAPAAFQPQTTFATGSTPSNVEMADLNGDGKPDIIVSDGGSGSVSVLLGNGNGTFQSQLNFATGGIPDSLAVGAVTGDGIPDIVVGNATSDNLGVLLGNGNGTFQKQVTFTTGANPLAVRIADVNGDGKADVIVGNAGGNAVGVLLGNGNGTFQSQLNFSTSYPAPVIVGDVNGDGNLDVIAGNRHNSAVSVLLGNGNGTFQNQMSFATGADPQSVAVASIDGTGKADLLVANFGSNDISVLLGNGNGTFQGQLTFATGAVPYFVTADDVNGDGNSDLVVANSSGNSVSLLLGNGNGTFQSQTPFAVGTTPIWLAALDVSGDGRPDLVVANANSNNVSVLLNAGNGNFTGQVYTIGSMAAATHFAIVGLPNPVPIGTGLAFTVEALDSANNIALSYNGTVHFSSGDSHAVLPASAPLTAGVGTFSATLGTLGSQSLTVTGPTLGNPKFVSAPGSPFGMNATTVLTGGVFGNNGVFDIAGIDDYNSNVTVYLNSGNGTFTTGSMNSTSFDPQNPEVGDFNGDGILDLATPIGNNNIINVFLGNGNGTFGPAASYQVGNQPTGMTVGDFNGDGKQDLAVINYNDDTMSVLIANPNAAFGATFGPPTNYPLGSTPHAIATGDFNNDGKLDLIVTNTGNNDVEVFLSNGNGTFQQGTTFAAAISPAPRINPSTIAVGEFSGDGNMDIAVSNPSTNSISVLLGNGNATFGSPTTYSAGINADFPVAVDINGDGKTDLVLSDVNNNTLCVLLGNGNGTFAQGQFTSTPTGGSTSLQIADMNGDGAPDIAYAASSELYVLLNQPLSGTTTVAVGAAAATHFTITSPSSAAAGKAISVTVTGFDQFNDIATGYAGSVVFSSSDSAATLPTNGRLTSGVGTFSATFETIGAQALTAADSASGGITGTDSAIEVSGPATHFTISPPVVTVPVSLLLKSDGTVVAAGLGSGAASQSLQARLDTPNTNGLTFSPVLVGGYGVSIQVPGGYPTGTSLINIPPGDGESGYYESTFDLPSGFTNIQLSGSALADDILRVWLNGNPLSPSVLSSSPQPIQSGGGTFQTQNPAYFNTGQNVLLISLVNTGGPSAIGFFANISYSYPQAAGARPAGTPLIVTVTAEDSSGNTALGYSGTVHLASSDSLAILPANAALADGVGVFSLTLDTAGNQTLTAVDTGVSSLTGASSPITVSAGSATRFVITGVPSNTTAGLPVHFTVTAEDPFNNTVTAFPGTVHFTSSDSRAVLPGDSTLNSGMGIFSATLTTAGSQTLTAAGPNGNVIVNGSFEAGNVGFSSGYSYSPGNLIGIQTYDVVTNPYLDHYAATSYGDHTTGSGLMMALDGATQSNAVVWSETVPVSPGVAYAFAIWVSSWDEPSPADLNFLFNSVSIGNFTAPSTAGVWQQYSANWNSGGVSSVTISIIDLNTAFSWNDFAIDDISLQSPTSAGNDIATVSVAPASASHLVVSAPGNIAVGTTLIATVTAEDPFNNTATAYGGSVTLTSSDSSAVLPPARVLNSGVGIFSATLVTGGNQTLTASDTATISITGASNAINVIDTTPHFQVSTGASITAGNVFSFTVTALDALSHKNPGYTGIVHFASTDSQAVLPANSTLAGGVGVFSATLKTAGNQTISATDAAASSLTGASSAVAVAPAAAISFVVSAAPSVPVASAFVFTVTALDSFNNVATGYNGSVHFSSSDSGASVPGNSTMTSGVGYFGAALRTAGEQTLTVTDVNTSTITGSTPIIATAAFANHLAFSAPATATAGDPFVVTVTALDLLNNIATNYNGVVYFTSSDGQATLAADAKLTNGIGLFAAILGTTGNQTLTATDTVTISITGTSIITVTSGPATQFIVSSPSTATAGVAFNVTVTALTSFNYTASAYTGTVHFTSTDSQAVLPPDAMLANGVGIFSVTLKTAGAHDVTAQDTVASSLSSTSGTVTVVAAPTSHLAISGVLANSTAGAAFPYTVTAEDQFNNTATTFAGTVHFSSSDSLAVLPANTTFSSSVGIFSATFVTAGTQSLSASSPNIGGNAQFVEAPGSPIAIDSSPGDIKTVDLIGNGKLDLVVTNSDVNTVSVLLGNGNGTFQSSTSYAVGASPYGVAVGDIDGKIGIVTANEQSNSLSVLLGNGNGTFQAATTYAAGNDPQLVALGDFNGDGTLDLATANLRSNNVSVLLGNSNGTFGPAVNYSAGSGPGGVTVAYLDGSNADLVVTNLFDNDISVLMGNGNGTFAPPVNYNVGGLPVFVAVSDVNGDGKPDVAVANYNTSNVSVLLGNGNGTFQGAQTFGAVSEARSLAVADLNGDGKQDVIVANQGSTAVSLLLGNGDGTFAAAQNTNVDITQPVGVVAGDFTGSGVLDVAVGNRGAPDVTILLNQPSSAGAATAATTVSPAPASQFLVAGPGSATAGTGFNFTVTAEDPFNNLATNYGGTVSFSSTDTGNSTLLPVESVLTSGVGTFSATLSTAGSQTLIAVDASNSTVAGTSGPIAVSASVPMHLVVSDPPSTAGLAFGFTVTALDRFNNIATSYQGTVDFSCSDSNAKLPADVVLVSGAGTFSATLTTTGDQTLTASDTTNPSLTATSPQITVEPARINRFALVTNVGNVTAGQPLVLVVSAIDQYNNLDTTYTGTLQFTSSDSQAGLPANATLTDGFGYFAVALKSAGPQSITAADTVVSSVSSSTNAIIVTPASATHFAVVPVGPTTYAGVAAAYPTTPAAASSFANTGSPFAFTVTALDAYGNVTPSFDGTLGFKSSDTAAGVALPSSGAITNGTGVFTATLMTPGNQSISATELGNSSLTGSANIATRGLVVTGFTPTPSGFTISFNKPFNASAVDLYTSPQTGLPDDVTLTTSGTQVSIPGSLVFNTASSVTFVKADLISATGAFNPTNGLLSVGKYTVALRSYNGKSGFADSLNGLLDGTDSGQPGANYQITFSVAAPPVAIGLPDFARGPSNTDALFFSPALGNGNTFTLSFTNPSASPQSGTATVTFSTNAATLQNSIQAALNAMPQVGSTSGTPNAVVIVTNDVTSGANVLVTFQNVLAGPGPLMTSTTAGVSISTATINLPNNLPGSGIPIALSNGQNVTSGTFVLEYNTGLLTVEGVASKLTGAGATITWSNVISGSLGSLTLSLSSPSPISTATGPITLGSLLATVPLSATANYGAQQLLQFTSEQLNGGAIAVTNQAAVEVAAYLGDVTDTGGPLNLFDARAIAAVSGVTANTTTQTLAGFAAFPYVDPVIIGDVTSQGTVTTTDAGVMNQVAGGTAKTSIPYAPLGLSVVPSGPDPTLSVPAVEPVAAGQSVVVPVDIDTPRPEGSTGMMDAMLALTYNPQLYSVSASDIQLGTVPEGGSGWTLQAEVNQETGQIGIELYSNTAIQRVDSGSLVTVKLTAISYQLSAGADSPLTIVPFADPTGGLRAYATQVSDGRGAYVLQIASDNTQLGANNQQAPPEITAIAASADAMSAAVDPTVAKDESDAADLAVHMSRAATDYVFVADYAGTPAWSDMASSDAALSMAPSTSPGLDWLTEQVLAEFGQTLGRSLLSPTDPVLDASQTELDGDN